MKQRLLSQYMTPEWAAQEIVDEMFPDLASADTVLEPSCGTGAFLKAIPPTVHAVGVEIDEELAEFARANTGRKVICGDFRMVNLRGIDPTVVLGNPPYKMTVLKDFLSRASIILPENGRCGFLLSTYLLQTPSTVLRWNESWSIDQRLLPRTLFPRAIRPLVFVMFRKDKLRVMSGGFLCYRAASEISSMPSKYKLILSDGQPLKQCWKAVVDEALKSLGGKAHVQDIYRAVEPRRHTGNRWWKEKVRQTLQRHFVPVGEGVWRIAA